MIMTLSPAPMQNGRYIVPMPDGTEMVATLYNGKANLRKRHKGEALIEIMAWITAIWLFSLVILTLMWKVEIVVRVLMFGIGALILLKLSLDKFYPKGRR